MKILADTNILISALIYPNSKPALALFHSAQYHNLILSDYNIAELRRIANQKFAKTQPDIDVFLMELTFELVIAPQAPQKLITDPNDAPILNAAILSDVDLIISGDKHFLNLDMERPRCLTAAQFLDEEGVE